MSQFHAHHEEHAHHEHKHEHAILSKDCDGEGHEHHHHEDGSCCCEHHAAEYHGLSRLMIFRLLCSLLLFITATVMQGGHHHGEHHEFSFAALMMIMAAVIAGYDIILSAFRHLLKKGVFDEYFLMSFAAVIACVMGEFQEGAAVMVLYRVGISFQSFAIYRSRKKLRELTGVEHEPVKSLDGKTEHFITAFSRIYTPSILLIAAGICLVMPWLGGISFADSVYRALSFLVLACPCAVVISLPMAYFAGIASASGKGVYFSDSASVDRLAKDKEYSCHFQQKVVSGRELLLYAPNGEAFDVVIRTDEGMSMKKAACMALQIRRIARQNVIFVLTVKCLVLILSAFGVSALWVAVFADSGVTVLAVLNSLRAFQSK